jgi:DNA-binding NarL/FixJ family response regulator
MNDALRVAREAFDRRDWETARDAFSEASSHAPLDADDLNALGDSAWWLGDIDTALAAYEGAYRLYLQGEQPRRAALSALGLGVSLFLRGESTIASGWMNRAQRLLQDEPEGPEHGYLLYLDVESALEEGDLEGVIERAKVIGEAGRRYQDPNLSSAGVLFEGRALVRQGRMDEGMALLDEAMVAVVSDELTPEWAGNIYCHLMAAFHELADFRRARDWVEATTRWLESLPAAVLFTGICRVHRSQVLQVIGSWERAEREALEVCRALARVHVAAAAEGHYQVGEIRRLRGDFSAAERSYHEAHERGRDPQPGLALMRLAQGRPDSAAASIAAALAAEAGGALARAPLCAAQVEIGVARGDVENARSGCEELEATASVYGSSGLEAMALHARGAVGLAEGRPDVGLPALRKACRRWRELNADYDASRVCVLLARAYAFLGDSDSAQRELETAAEAFERLGAIPDLKTVTALRQADALPGGLTKREVEVLRLVAVGRSNKEIARSLSISEKTVARHLANIFTRLGVSSRTEAAAFAFQNDLVAPGDG